MSDTTLQALQRRTDELQARYQYGFAGKPRATRDLTMLDELIATGRALLTEAEGTKGGDAVATSIRERIDVYLREREAIVQAQQAGPDARRAAILATRANQTFAVYRRHFAGQSRTTRDVALLDEMIAELESVAADMAALATRFVHDGLERDRQVVANNLESWRRERDAVLQAQTPDDTTQLASVLAGLANGQFELYRIHFAGQPRLSRRPALIQRVLRRLDEIDRGMAKVEKDGAAPDFNARNREIVAERTAVYRKEADAIAEARQGTTPGELIDALAQAANAVMDEYHEHFAGKDRATRDLSKLVELTDRMWEIERQMWALDRALDDVANQRNIGIVHDALNVYAGEYDRIREAQQH